MKNLIRLAGLLVLGLALIVPSFAGDEKKVKADGVGKVKNDDDPDEPKDEKKTTKKGTKKTTKATEKKFTAQPNFMGKLAQMDANSQRDFTVQVTLYEPNPGGWNHLANLQQQLARQQFDFAQARNIQGKQNAANAMRNTQIEILKAQQPQKLYQPKNVDVKLRAVEDIKVRWNYPPPDYDDKGNLKKYTKEELKALKGDEGLPGYKGEYDALRQGQTIAIYLVQKDALKSLKGANLKGAKGKAPPPPQKGKKITEDDEVDLQDRHEVRMIVIMAEPKQQ
jgi:hypothetical protein